jgi:hypothetical protein
LHVATVGREQWACKHAKCSDFNKIRLAPKASLLASPRRSGQCGRGIPLRQTMR